jgi:hypothetical protein
LDLSSVHKKIAEADFFLGKMREQEQRFVGDREPFDYYLSAFLSAARTVDYRLRHEQGAIYRPWRAAWDASVTPEENALLKFLVDDRNVEVHASGSRRSVGQEGVPLPSGMYRTPHDGIFVSDNLPGAGPNLIYRPTYSFTIDGTDRKATEACAAYLALLRRMLTDFEAANGKLATHSKEVLEQFCTLCDWILQSWQMRKYLFDENPDIDSLKAPHYEHFFFRLSVILQEYWLQQVAKLHDPAVQLGYSNLSIDYVIDCGEWDTKTKAELRSVRNKMMAFETKLRAVRNKLLSHNDLTTILQAHELGGFDEGDDTEYFAHLAKFASTVRKAMFGELFLYDDLVRNDIDLFMAAFNRGRIGA